MWGQGLLCSFMRTVCLLCAVCYETCVWIAFSPLLPAHPSLHLSYLSKLPVWRRWRHRRRRQRLPCPWSRSLLLLRRRSVRRSPVRPLPVPVAWQMLCLNLRGWPRRTDGDFFTPVSSAPDAESRTPAGSSFVAPIAVKNYSAIHPLCRKILKMRLWGIPLGWWANTVDTYCSATAHPCRPSQL